MKWFKQVIRNNTGYSSKSFVMVLGAIIAGFLGLVVGCHIIWATVSGSVIDWYGIASVIV